MERQQLQVNEQKMIETEPYGVKTISHTHMIEHIICESEVDIENKIEVYNADEADREILKKYVEQLLNLTENHILKSKTAEDLIK